MNNYSSQLNLRGLESCPHVLNSRSQDDVDHCDINDKQCELESGNTCEEWDTIQGKRNHEKLVAYQHSRKPF